MTAIDLVEQAQLTPNEKVGEGNLPVVEMREIDAGIENTATGVFRMLHRAPA